MIETVQFRPAGNAAPHVSVVVKSDAFAPEIAIRLTFRGDRPVFITVTETGALETPIA